MPFRKINTIYVYRTFNDGTIGTFVFDQATLNPQVPWTEQLEICLFADRKSFADQLVDAAGVIMACTHAMGVMVQELREAHIQKAVEAERAAPVSEEELAKLAAYFDGVSLDPGDDIALVQKKLLKKDQEEKEV